MDREPIRAADSPGFIVNRCNRPFSLEALRMLGEGFATHAEIDAAMRERGGYRMGPFELMDLIGVDVNLEVARSFYRQRPEPRWEPHPIQEEMVEAGRLGRKAGAGFYEYAGGRRRRPGLEPGRQPADPEAILERIVAQLVNEASFAVEEGVARPDDIDTADEARPEPPPGAVRVAARAGRRATRARCSTRLARPARRARALPRRAAAAGGDRRLRRALSGGLGASASPPGSRPSAARYEPPTISARPASVETLIDSSRRTRAVDHGERRRQVGDDERPGRADPGHQVVEDRERDPGPEHAERDHRGDRAGSRGARRAR